MALCCETVLVFFAKDNFDRQKNEVEAHYLFENTCPIFLFIYKTFNLSIRKRQVLRIDGDFLK